MPGVKIERPHLRHLPSPDPGLFLGLPLPLSTPFHRPASSSPGCARTSATSLGARELRPARLLFHRPTRFNPLLPETSAQRRVFFWRKTNRLLNTVFTFGLLNDGRMRELVETTRGALFTHTQNTDLRFDDITNAPPAGFPPDDRNRRLLDIARFIEEQIDPPALRDLLESGRPNCRLVADPFAPCRSEPSSGAAPGLSRRHALPQPAERVRQP